MPYVAKFTTDRVVRYRPIKSTGAMILWHPCCECGNVNDACYGIGFGIGGSLGTWYCADHLPSEFSRLRVQPVPPTVTTTEDIF